MNTVNFNGQLFPATTPLFQSTNRAFNYGDGLFETIRIHRGRLLFLSRHWQRLTESMAALQIHWPDDFDQEDFARECLRIYPGHGDFRIRATVWRAGAGLYTPQMNHANFLIAGTPLDSAPYPFNEVGLEVGLFDQIPLSAHAYSWIKSTNSMAYVMAALHKQTEQWDDCLLVNAAGNMVEASSSNIFISKNGRISTPPLSEGGVRGIMRSVVLDVARSKGWEVEERALRQADLLAAEELFFSNAIQGIKWVKKYKNSTFGSYQSQSLSEAIAQLAKNS